MLHVSVLKDDHLALKSTAKNVTDMHEDILKFVRSHIFLHTYRLQNCRNTDVC